MTPAPILCILPASRARRAECARGDLPWRAPVTPPQPDDDEDDPPFTAATPRVLDDS